MKSKTNQVVKVSTTASPGSVVSSGTTTQTLRIGPGAGWNPFGVSATGSSVVASSFCIRCRIRDPKQQVHATFIIKGFAVCEPCADFLLKSDDEDIKLLKAGLVLEEAKEVRK